MAEGIKAGVSTDGIFISAQVNENMPSIETGDIIEHMQSNGVTEKYEVLDPRYTGTTGLKNSRFNNTYSCLVKKYSQL